MQYSYEDAAVLTGFLESYLDRDSVAPSVREEYQRFVLRLHSGCLMYADFLWAEKVLLFLKPFWWQEREDQRALANALLRTRTLSRELK